MKHSILVITEEAKITTVASGMYCQFQLSVSIFYGRLWDYFIWLAYILISREMQLLAGITIKSMLFSSNPSVPESIRRKLVECVAYR